MYSSGLELKDNEVTKIRLLNSKDPGVDGDDNVAGGGTGAAGYMVIF